VAVPASARPDTTLRRRPGRRDAGAVGGIAPGHGTGACPRSARQAARVPAPPGGEPRSRSVLTPRRRRRRLPAGPL